MWLELAGVLIVLAGVLVLRGFGRRRKDGVRQEGTKYANDFFVVTRPFVTALHVNLRFRPQRLFYIAKGSTRTLQAIPHSNSGQSILIRYRADVSWDEHKLSWDGH